MESLGLQGLGWGLGKLTPSCVLAPLSTSVMWGTGQLSPDASSFCPLSWCCPCQHSVPGLLRNRPSLLSFYSSISLSIRKKKGNKGQLSEWRESGRAGERRKQLTRSRYHDMTKKNPLPSKAFWQPGLWGAGCHTACSMAHPLGSCSTSSRTEDLDLQA